jgi:hypothetical protein
VIDVPHRAIPLNLTPTAPAFAGASAATERPAWRFGRWTVAGMAAGGAMLTAAILAVALRAPPEEVSPTPPAEHAEAQAVRPSLPSGKKSPGPVGPAVVSTTSPAEAQIPPIAKTPPAPPPEQPKPAPPQAPVKPAPDAKESSQAAKQDDGREQTLRAFIKEARAAIALLDLDAAGNPALAAKTFNDQVEKAAQALARVPRPGPAPAEKESHEVAKAVVRDLRLSAGALAVARNFRRLRVVGQWTAESLDSLAAFLRDGRVPRMPRTATRQRTPFKDALFHWLIEAKVVVAVFEAGDGLRQYQRELQNLDSEFSRVPVPDADKKAVAIYDAAKRMTAALRERTAEMKTIAELRGLGANKEAAEQLAKGKEVTGLHQEILAAIENFVLEPQ